MKTEIGDLLIITAILTTWNIIVTSSEPCSRRFPCKFTRVRKMRAADCFKLDFMIIPTCLSSDIEILDLSFNRIKKLKKGDLGNYGSLKMLYLSDNMIMVIEDGFFEDATGLSVLDLSRNGISYLSPLIFNLPSLNKLYLSENFKLNIVEAVELAKPVRSPLERLDISFNELTTLPDFDILVDLVEYNISGNNIENLTPKYFAGLCNLQLLHHDNSTVTFPSPCECHKLNSWMDKRRVMSKPFDCVGEEVDGCNYEVENNDSTMYQKCKSTHEALVVKAKLLKILLPTVLVIVLVICLLIYWCWRRRTRRRLARNPRYRKPPDFIKELENTMLKVDVEEKGKSFQ